MHTRDVSRDIPAQAFDAPNDGIAYDPSLAQAPPPAAAAAAAAAAGRQQLDSPLRSVAGYTPHSLSQDAGNPLNGDYGANE